MAGPAGLMVMQAVDTLAATLALGGEECRVLNRFWERCFPVADILCDYPLPLGIRKSNNNDVPTIMMSRSALKGSKYLVGSLGRARRRVSSSSSSSRGSTFGRSFPPLESELLLLRRMSSSLMVLKESLSGEYCSARVTCVDMMRAGHRTARERAARL